LTPHHPELEFLLVSNDYAILSAVTAGTKQLGAHLALVPTADEAREFLSRRKIDGVFVDMQLPGAQAMIESTRKGSSNAKAAVFACVADAKESTSTLNAGANFLLRRPLTPEAVVLHITIAKDIMLREKRRFFRHPVDLAITLKTGGNAEQHVKLVNLSEGGMAVRTGKALQPGASVEFAFELAVGEELRGKGLVAWTSSEGMAGILVQTLHGLGRGYLDRWLRSRENLGADRSSSANRS
jgi:response regulator RpfG family c-di-GMP phosphodiesterase